MSDVVFDRISIYSTHHGICIDWRGAGRLTNAIFSIINVLRADWVGTGDFESQNWMGAAQPFSITNKGGGLLNPNETIGRVTNVLVENFTAVSENGFFVADWAAMTHQRSVASRTFHSCWADYLCGALNMQGDPVCNCTQSF